MGDPADEAITVTRQFEDPSERKSITEALETVHGWRERLAVADTETELFDAVVDIVRNELQFSSATIYRFDEEAAELRPEVTSVDDVAAVSPGDHPVWRAFRDGTAAICEGLETGDDEPDRYRIAVPLGQNGVLAAGETERPEEEGLVAIVRTLGAIGGSVLEAIRYETRLQERDRELQQRTRALEGIKRVIETYRGVSRATVAADTWAELDRGICDRIVENDVVEFVWIGELDRASGEISPRAWAGAEQGYLEDIPSDLESSGEPTARAVRSKEVTVVENVASGAVDEPWRSGALERGFRSVMAVPVMHDGILHGVVTTYADRPNAFEGAIRLAEEMGGLVGYAITAIQCQDGLLAHTSTELDIEVTAPACFFVRFVRETGASVSFEAMAPGEDGSVLVFVEADEPELLAEYAGESVAVDSIERLDEETNGNVVRGQFDGNSFIGSYLATHGITLESASATPEEVRITVSIPPGMTPRRALEIVNSEYPGSTLLAKREGGKHSGGPIASRLGLLERLTDRQREVVERAYREGYFETPKQTTGESLAASMDISASAFHNHLRGAEAELFAWLFEDESDR